MIQGKFIINYGEKVGLRKVRSNPHAMIRLNGDVGGLYRWFVLKKFWILLQPPILGSHITILNGKERLTDAALKKLQEFDGKTFTIEYGTEVGRAWKFWWIPVKGDIVDKIRGELGLKKLINPHITIGREFENPADGNFMAKRPPI